MGKKLVIVGFIIGALNYLVTAGYFFSDGRVLLGLILLLVPPSELVLPWVASTTLGIVSAVGLLFMIVGVALSSEK